MRVEMRDGFRFIIWSRELLKARELLSLQYLYLLQAKLNIVYKICRKILDKMLLADGVLAM